jgi:hypothetical protein
MLQYLVLHSVQSQFNYLTLRFGKIINILYWKLKAMKMGKFHIH